jgi:hypothetical protein
MHRRFPSPWSAERIPGGYVVKDATGQSLAYVYARDTKAQADSEGAHDGRSAKDRGEYCQVAGPVIEESEGLERRAPRRR